MFAGGRGFVEGLHDVEDVVGELTAGAMVAPTAHGGSQIGNAQATAVFGVDMGEWHLLPVAVGGGAKADGAAKGVGIGQAEGGIGAVNLQPWQLRSLHIKGSDDIANGTAGELKQPYHMGRHFDLDGRAIFGLAGNQARAKAGTGQTGYPAHGTKNRNQRREVIRPHVKHWATTGLVIEFWAGVPVLMAA